MGSESLTFLASIPVELVESELPKDAQDKASSFDCLPVEIALRVFTFLQPKDLFQTSLVCKRWEYLSDDDSIWKTFVSLFPSLEIINPKTWREVAKLTTPGVTFSEDCLPRPKEIIKVLKKMSALTLEKPGIVLLTLPEGFRFAMAEALATEHGFEIKNTNYVSEKAPIDKTRVIVITRSAIKGHTGESFEKHQNLLTEKGFEMPDALPMLVIRLFDKIRDKENHKEDPKRKNPRALRSVRIEYDPDQPSSFYRCSDQHGRNNIIVGQADFFELNLDNNNYKTGVKAMWEFTNH